VSGLDGRSFVRGKTSNRHLARVVRLGVLATVVAFVVACGGAPVVERSPAMPDAERGYYLQPLAGFDRSLDAESRRQIEAAYNQLVLHRDSSEAHRVATDLRNRDPELAPARVLEAQARLYDGDFRGAAVLMDSLRFEFPQYLAAGMVFARASELQGDLVEAFAEYERLSPRVNVAFDRAVELRPGALEAQAQRVEEARSRGRVDEAVAALQLLQGWDPTSETTLQLSFEVARDVDDLPEQLRWIRELMALAPEDVELRSTWGELEMRGGDPNQALEIFQNLTRDYPADLYFADQFDRAKFIWRLRNLPPMVAETVSVRELTRADYAVLVYWLVPGVRAGGNPEAKIATDILDHPRRQEIMRVVNLDLMRLDESLRQFRPEEFVTRVDALRTLLLALQRMSPPAACVAGTTGGFASWDSACRAGVTCGVLVTSLDCLPSAPLSGREALEWIRLAVSF
jgi:tetratricopeptide (TPR) repeat protein